MVEKENPESGKADRQLVQGSVGGENRGRLRHRELGLIILLHHLWRDSKLQATFLAATESGELDIEERKLEREIEGTYDCHKYWTLHTD